MSENETEILRMLATQRGMVLHLPTAGEFMLTRGRTTVLRTRTVGEVYRALMDMRVITKVAA